MRFSVQTTVNTARLGLLTNIERLPSFEMETPHVFLYTKGGTVPHVTQDVLEMITNQRLGLNIPIPNIPYLNDRMKDFKQTVAEFIGMKEYMTYCGYVDPGEKRISGFHEKNKISVQTRCGRQKYTAESYMKYIENLKPDMFLLLSDGDTDSESTNKRVGKAVDNSISLFEKCMKIYDESPTLKSSQVIGAVEGGFDLTLREKSSKFIGQSNVFGVVLDGLHDCSETVAEMTSENVKELIQLSLKNIPNDKLRIIHGCWNPSVVMDLIEMGMDVFDTSFPTYVSDHGGALIFPNANFNMENGFSNGVTEKQNFKHASGVSEEASSNSQEEKTEEPASKKIKLMKKSKYHISLRDPIHVSDFSPILGNCTCLTCKNHTKAYIHHLLSVGELLGPTLLMIHNLHHYFVFFSTIRNALRSGKFQEVHKGFQKWADEMDNHTSPS